MILLPFEEIRRIRGAGFAHLIHLPLRLGLQNFLQSVSLHYTPKSDVCHVFDICNKTSSLVFDKLFDLLAVKAK